MEVLIGRLHTLCVPRNRNEDMILRRRLQVTHQVHRCLKSDNVVAKRTMTGHNFCISGNDNGHSMQCFLPLSKCRKSAGVNSLRQGIGWNSGQFWHANDMVWC
eukprot:1948076-Amphidinium_carterae.2